MKKSVLFSFVLVIFLFSTFSSVLAVSNVSESTMANNAYSCLNDKVDIKTCEKMSMPELIFSTMATGECESELKAKAQTLDDELECWPKGGCDVKTTAQAVMALNLNEKDSEKIVDYFNSQRIVPKDVNWFLQIDTENASSCTIDYSGNSYTTEILENKKFTKNAGNCLIPTDSEYWLKIQPSCYEKEFEISCDKRFVTSLLFKEKTSSTIHVSKESTSMPEGGLSLEKINSFCFKGGNTCDYEGTLWAISALQKLDYGVLPFVPYLITAKETNKAIFSQPLLYILTGYQEYKSEILDRQVAEKYWQSKDGKYFDTALALLPFIGEDFTEKANTIKWLSEIQDENGCWDEGNIESMGFLLSSIWPEYWGSSNGGGSHNTPDNDCELSGYYCENVFDRGNSFMSEYSCVGTSQKCYDTPSITETCTSKYPDADICNYNEICQDGGTILDGETCCIASECIPKVDEQVSSDCETVALGSCSSSCSSGEIEEEAYSITCSEILYGDVCCVQQENTTSYLWLWLLFGLIILITIAIIYRDKIKEEILKIKRKGNNNGSSKGDGNRPSNPQFTQNMRQRRIIPNSRPPMQRPQINRQISQRPPMQRPQINRSNTDRQRQKTPEELNDVLRKLKDMSK